MVWSPAPSAALLHLDLYVISGMVKWVVQDRQASAHRIFVEDAELTPHKSHSPLCDVSDSVLEYRFTLAATELVECAAEGMWITHAELKGVACLFLV